MLLRQGYPCSSDFTGSRHGKTLSQVQAICNFALYKRQICNPGCSKYVPQVVSEEQASRSSRSKRHVSANDILERCVAIFGFLQHVALTCSQERMAPGSGRPHRLSFHQVYWAPNAPRTSFRSLPSTTSWWNSRRQAGIERGLPTPHRLVGIAF